MMLWQFPRKMFITKSFFSSGFSTTSTLNIHAYRFLTNVIDHSGETYQEGFILIFCKKIAMTMGLYYKFPDVNLPFHLNDCIPFCIYNGLEELPSQDLGVFILQIFLPCHHKLPVRFSSDKWRISVFSSWNKII